MATETLYVPVANLLGYGDKYCIIGRKGLTLPYYIKFRSMKGIFVKICLAAVCMTFSLVAFADALSELPVKTINGVRYHTYTVARYETVYSLCKRFGVTREEMLKYNPSVADGLKAGQELRFPVKNNVRVPQEQFAPKENENSKPTVPKENSTPQSVDSKQVQQSNVSVHDGNIMLYEVQPMESAYGISKRFGMTLDEFFRLNPGVERAGINAGEYVKVKKQGASVSESENSDKYNNSEVQETTTYKVERGDTFSSLSRRFNVTVAEIQAVNPHVVMLRAGETINIPVKNDYADSQQPSEEGVEERIIVQSIPQEEPVETYPKFEAQRSDEIVVALVLPFKLGQEDKEKPAQLFAEFYKGFMLAVDSMRACGKPVKILAYDTNGTMDGLKETLRQPLLSTAQVIIGPDDEQQLRLLAEYAKENGSSVLNIFAARDNSYLTMDNMLNSIVPHTTMYAKAIQYLLKQFPAAEPVILKRRDGLSDKSEYIDSFRQELDAAGRKYHIIEFERALAEEDLAGLSTSGNYAFLPMSSKLSELKAVLPQITMFAANSTGKCTLWGYPEWLSFRGEVTSGMHKLDTYIFSRFYNTGRVDPMVSNIERQFAKWYGGAMINVIPSQGLYGFDTAMYLLRALRVNGGDFSLYTPAYDGVQNCFNFASEPGAAGLVNNEMFIINYAPAGGIAKYPL